MNKIKEKITLLRKLFISETPVLYRYVQTISVAIAALPLYYASLPSQFQSSIPDCWLKYITISGAVCAFALQFKTNKKANESEELDSLDNKISEINKK